MSTSPPRRWISSMTAAKHAETTFRASRRSAPRRSCNEIVALGPGGGRPDDRGDHDLRAGSSPTSTSPSKDRSNDDDDEPNEPRSRSGPHDAPLPSQHPQHGAGGHLHVPADVDGNHGGVRGERVRATSRGGVARDALEEHARGTCAACGGMLALSVAIGGRSRVRRFWHVREEAFHFWRTLLDLVGPSNFPLALTVCSVLCAREFRFEVRLPVGPSSTLASEVGTAATDGGVAPPSTGARASRATD